MPEFENGGGAAAAQGTASAAVSTQSAQRVVMAPEMVRRRNWRGPAWPSAPSANPGGAYMNRRQYQAQFHERERDQDATNAQVVTVPEACKEFTVTGHSNARGAFIRIQELDTRKGIRDMLCIPAEGVEELITALQHVAMELHGKGLMPAAKE